VGNGMQMIDLEEPMTKEETKELEKALKSVTEDGVLLQDVLFKVLQVNGYVSVYHNDKYVIIENTKKGTSSVPLKVRTFDKIAKALGYRRGQND
jgi:hypothetical protein